MAIQKVCVVGAGRMGRQIGLCAAIYGYQVKVFDANPEVLEDVARWEEEYLAGRIAKKRMTEKQVAGIKERFSKVSDLKVACGDADLVIEAIYEDEDAKHAVFRQISGLIRDDTIVATNSSVMVSSIFKDDVKNPARLCNMHFYNPVLVMKFVEVVQGPHTSEETGREAYDFCLSMEKTPVLQKKELRGYLGNLIIGKINKTSTSFYAEGYGTYQEADMIQERIFGRKKGTFHLMDMSLSLSYMRNKLAFEKDGVKGPLYDLVKNTYEAGRHGVVNGHGFYDYEPPYTVPMFRDRSDADPDAKKIASVLVIGGERAEEIAKSLEQAGVRVRFAAWDGTVPEPDGADLILEDIGGTPEEKKAFYKALSGKVPADTILASNDYEILSSQVSEAVENPQRFMSAHFAPGGDGKVVEIVMNGQTGKEAAGAVYDLCLAAGLCPVWQQKEIPEYGYLSRHFIQAMKESAAFLVDGGYCARKDIDVCLINGIGFTCDYDELLARAR